MHYKDTSKFLDVSVKKKMIFGNGKINYIYYPNEIRNKKRLNFDPTMLENISVEKTKIIKSEENIKEYLLQDSRKWAYNRETSKMVQITSENCFISNVKIENFTTLIPIYLLTSSNKKNYCVPGVSNIFLIERKYVIRLIICSIIIIVDFIFFLKIKDVLGFNYESAFLLFVFFGIPLLCIKYFIYANKYDRTILGQYSNFKVKKHEKKTYSTTEENLKEKK